MRALGARVIIVYSGSGEKFTLGGETEIELAGWVIGANHKAHGNHVLPSRLPHTLSIH